MKSRLRSRLGRLSPWPILAILFVALLALALGSVPGASAAPAVEGPLTILTSPTSRLVLMPTAQRDVHSQPDLPCVLCHQDTDEEVVFPSGETRKAQVDVAELDASVHGEAGLDCTSCHDRADYQYPHPPPTAENLREYEIARSESCEDCHIEPHLTSHPGPESDNPVVCTDCHGAHDVVAAADWGTGQEVATCILCHTAQGLAFTSASRLTHVVENGMFAERPDNDYCLSCHSLTNFFMEFTNGERLYLTIDAERFHDSVHGEDNSWQELACVDCHEDYLFPHEPVAEDSAREYTLNKQIVCARCHEPKYDATQDSVHAAAQEEGKIEAAVCTDCHGAHDTPPPTEPRSRSSYTCGQCHSTIFNEYATSVHGEALLEDSNPDVAVCIDCHGVHDIGDPNLAVFRNSSPELCGECHADDELMEKYDISTEVFDTYVDDFHGTTVTLFDIQDPTVETNKAVCYDCHGVHDIRPPDEPNSGIKDNLLETCRKCHPDASDNFPDSWTSHFQPSLQHNPGVYLVNLFYDLVIPGTMLFMAVVLGTDVYRRVRSRREKTS